MKFVPDEIVSKFCPEIVFHKREKYFPSSADFYINSADISKTGHLNLRNKIDRMGEHDVSRVPIYITTKRVRHLETKQLLAIEMNYILFFPYKNKGLFGITGNEGDWQHITIRLTPELELEGVYYSNNSIGTWIKGTDVPRNPQTGRILAYSSMGSHCLWPTCNIYSRSNYNNHWVPGQIKTLYAICNENVYQSQIPDNLAVNYSFDIYDNHGYPSVTGEFGMWQRFNGMWGKSRSYKDNDWFNRAENTSSSNLYSRCLTLF